MSNFLSSNHHYIVGAALLATSSVAAYSTYRLMTQDRGKPQQDNVYETAKLVNEYLVFNYGAPEEVCRYEFGPRDALDFPKRVADECLNAFQNVDKVNLRLRNISNFITVVIHHHSSVMTPTINHQKCAQ